MNKIILFLAILFPLSAFYQGNPYVTSAGSTVAWYNEAGTRVYTFSSTADTLVTQAFDLWSYDEIIAAWSGLQNDTGHFNLLFQVGVGGGTTSGGSGIYQNGWETMVFLDSASTAGGRGLAGVHGVITPDLLRKTLLTPDANNDRDSTATYTYGNVSKDLKDGYPKVRFVVTSHLDVGYDITNTTLLNQFNFYQRRKDK